MHKTLLTLSIAALLTTGCAFNPDMTMPATELPAAQSSATVNKDWWTLFGDPVLNQFITTAQANNQSLAIVIAKLDESRALLGIASAAQLPRLDLGGGASRSQASDNIGYPATGPNNDFKLVGQVSWELDLWGRVRNTTLAAQQDLMAAEYNRDAVELSLAAEVTQNYFNLRALDNQLTIAESTVKSRVEAYDLQQKRFKGGVTSELDVRQAEVELASAKSMLPDLKKSIAQIEGALSVLIGQSPRSLMNDGLVRGKSVSELLIVAPIPGQLSSDLLLRRADIAQAEANLQAARARIQAARAAYFPKISLTGLLGLQSNDLGQLFNASSNTWAFAGNLAMPLFDGGLTAAQVDQAKARERQAAATYQLTVQRAFAETRASLVTNQVVQEKVVTEQTRVTAIQRQLKLANLRYENGYSSYLEVLDAQRSLFNSQLTLISAQRDQINSRVELYKALGGGWERVTTK